MLSAILRRGLLQRRALPQYEIIYSTVRSPKSFTFISTHRTNSISSQAAQQEYGEALPPGYEPPKIVIAKADAPEIEADTKIIIMIPPRTVGQSPDPDGHTEWIVLGKTMQRLLGDPTRYQFQPVPKPSKEGSYIIKSTPTMGEGIFATRNIKMGEIIFAERPLLICPSAPFPQMSELKQREAELGEYSPKDLAKIFWFERELQLEVAMGKMDPERRKKLLALTNAFREDLEKGPLCGITTTNLYECRELWDEDPNSDANGSRHVYAVLCDIGSRINHSCQPNVQHGFNIRSFSVFFFARRDIKAGEQLFYPYVNLFTSAAERKVELLARYGITECTCASCTNATPETDALRKNFEPHIQEYFCRAEAWIVNRHVPDKSQVDEMLEYQRAVIKEGLESQFDYRQHFMPALIIACGLAKMESELVRNMKEMKKYSRATAVLRDALNE